MSVLVMMMMVMVIMMMVMVVMLIMVFRRWLVRESNPIQANAFRIFNTVIIIIIVIIIVIIVIIIIIIIIIITITTIVTINLERYKKSVSVCFPLQGSFLTISQKVVASQ